MRIHFLYSVKISNDSAFYFIEIIVLISWEGTLTQKRMGIASHSTPGGPWWDSMSSVCQNSKFFICHCCILYLVIICSDSFCYFLEMSMLIILVYPDSNKNGDRLHHISWYGHRRGQYAFLVLKSRIVYAFWPLIIILGFSTSLFFLKLLCLLDT